MLLCGCPDGVCSRGLSGRRLVVAPEACGGIRDGSPLYHEHVSSTVRRALTFCGIVANGGWFDVPRSSWREHAGRHFTVAVFVVWKGKVSFHLYRKLAMWLPSGTRIDKEQTVEMLASAPTGRPDLYRTETRNGVFAPTCANAAHHRVSGALIDAGSLASTIWYASREHSGVHRLDSPGIWPLRKASTNSRWSSRATSEYPMPKSTISLTNSSSLPPTASTISSSVWKPTIVGSESSSATQCTLAVARPR